MLLDLLADRSVLFVGGKGGVGKTSIAASLALARVDAGERALLISTDPAHNLGHLFDVAVGDTFVEVAPGLDVCELDPEQTMDTHLAAAERTMRRLMPEHLGAEVTKHLALARQAPGAAEAAVLERLAEVIEGAAAAYDLVVVDTAPSGHTVRLLGLPELVGAWTSGLLGAQERSERFADAMAGLDRRKTDPDPGAGLVPRSTKPQGRGRQRDREIRDILVRRQQRFAHLREVITDSRRSGFVVVLAAERLPVQETIELNAHLQRLGVGVNALVVNKRSPADQGSLLDHRRAAEEVHLEALRAVLPGPPLVQVPLLPADLHGTAGVRELLVYL